MGLRQSIEAFLAGRKEISMMRRSVQHFKGVAIESQRRMAAVQHLSNILTNTGDASPSAYVGNAYPSYSEQVNELDSKYRGVADWGNQIAATIVDVRAAFTIGQGLKPKLKSGKSSKTRELEFIQALMDNQNLDQEVPQSWAREAEIEGKFLCRLFPDPDKRSVKLRFIPWTTQGYEVVTPDGDYMTYDRVTYNLNKSGAKQDVSSDFFVYKKFGGRMHVVNEAPPKTGKILTSIENLDKALWDWRRINHFHASPTPYFEAPDIESAKAMQEALKALNWKIGKTLAGTGKFSINSLNGQGIADILEREITTSVKIVCASVSLPPHFLGFPDLMSNRSTSTDLFELIQSGTNSERKIWIGFYEELFKKAIRMVNLLFNAGLDEDAVGADIPFITAEKMKELVEVWLPILNAGAMSLETFIGKIPEIDSEEELSRIEDEKQANLEQAAAVADENGGTPQDHVRIAMNGAGAH